MFPLFRWLRPFRFLAQGQQGHTAEKQAHTGQLLAADGLMQQKDAPAGSAQRFHQGRGHDAQIKGIPSPWGCSSQSGGVQKWTGSSRIPLPAQSRSMMCSGAWTRPRGLLKTK